MEAIRQARTHRRRVARLLNLLDEKPEQVLREAKEMAPPSILPSKDIVIMAGLHKARIVSLDVSEEKREISRTWLRERGFKTGDE